MIVSFSDFDPSVLWTSPRGGEPSEYDFLDFEAWILRLGT